MSQPPSTQTGAQQEADQAGYTLILASGTLVSRVLGFLRDIITAWLLGPFSDIFLVAFRLPNFLRRVLAEGSLGMAQTSAFARDKTPSGESGLPGQVFSITVTAAFYLALALFLLAPLAVFILAPGFQTQSSSMNRLLSVHLFRLCLPYLPLCAASMTLGALLAAQSRFFAPAWAPCLLNASMILTPLAFLAFHNGAGLHNEDLASLLCLGLVLGGFLQAAALTLSFKHPGKRQGKGDSPGVFRSFFSNLKAGLQNRKAKDIVLATPVTLLGASAHHLHILAATFTASFLETGSISALYFAERLLELPLGIAGAAVGMASLPRLSALAEEKDRQNFRQTLGAAVRFSAFLSLPAAAGLVVLSPGLVRLLFGYAFEPGQLDVTAEALAAYALGLPAMCASRPLLQALAAISDRKSPIIAAGLSLAAMLALAVPGMRLYAPGIALALSAGAWLHVFILYLALRRKGLGATHAARHMLLYLGASVLMGFGIACLPALPPSPLPLALAVGGIVATAACLWFLLFSVLKTPEAEVLLGLFRKRRRAADSAGT